MADHSILCEFCPAIYRISADLLTREQGRFFAALNGWKLFPDRQWCSACREKREPWTPPTSHVPTPRLRRRVPYGAR